MKKTYKIDLLPEDFIGNEYTDPSDCPVARATKRKFKLEDVGCTKNEISFSGTVFKIVDEFLFEDYNFVKEQYQDPNHDTIYFVTLKEY